MESKGPDMYLRVEKERDRDLRPQGKGKEVYIEVSVNQGQVVNSKTLKTMSIPVGICHIKSITFNAFSAM